MARQQNCTWKPPCMRLHHSQTCSYQAVSQYWETSVACVIFNYEGYSEPVSEKPSRQSLNFRWHSVDGKYSALGITHPNTWVWSTDTHRRCCASHLLLDNQLKGLPCKMWRPRPAQQPWGVWPMPVPISQVTNKLYLNHSCMVTRSRLLSISHIHASSAGIGAVSQLVGNVHLYDCHECLAVMWQVSRNSIYRLLRINQTTAAFLWMSPDHLQGALCIPSHLNILVQSALEFTVPRYEVSLMNLPV